MNANIFAKRFEFITWRFQLQRPDNLLEAPGYHRGEWELLELQSINCDGPPWTTRSLAHSTHTAKGCGKTFPPNS